MTNDPHADATAEMLEHIGYTVDRIPESSVERADLWAHAHDDRLTVEVKSRVDDLGIVEELAANPGKVVTRETPMVRTDALGRIVRKAWKQIESSQAGFPGLGVLWFSPDPILGMSDAAEQMKANLFGSRGVSYRLNNNFEFGRAFLVGRTDFHRYPDVDAAVIQKGDELQLLVNPYSARKELLRASLLHRFFEAGGAVIDLDHPTNGGQYFILSSEIDRSDESAVLAELARLYPGHAFMFTDMQSFTGMVQFRRDELEE